MLDIHEKIDCFEKILLIKVDDYRTMIQEEIHFYFFAIIGEGSDIENFSFLNILENAEEIQAKIDLIVSKIVMHEHHAGIEDLIVEYTLV